MLLIVCGEDSYRLRERMRELIAGFRKKYDPVGLNLFRISGEIAEYGEVRQALRSAGFLGSRRMVIIDGLLYALRGAEFADLLQETAHADDDILILYEPCSRAELLKIKEIQGLISSSRLEEFSPLSGSKLTSWIKTEVKKLGSAIEPKALQALTAALGNDSWSIICELQKLAAYARGRTINFEDVNVLIKANAEENIFEFLDAIGAKDEKKAALTMHRELQMNEPQRLLAALVRQFRVLLLLDERKKQDGQIVPETFAKEAGLHPFVIKKSLQVLNNFKSQELRQIWNELLSIDRRIKTGTKNPTVLLDLFLAKLLKGI